MTEEELRAHLEPMVGHMISIGGGSPVKLFEVAQAESDEEYDQAWVTGDWIVRVGEPTSEWTVDENNDPVLNRGAWMVHTIKNWAAWGTNITQTD